MIPPDTDLQKPTLLFISHVIPLNPSSGQQQRVLQMITEGRKNFHVIFLTFSDKDKVQSLQDQMEKIVDQCVVLPSFYNKNLGTKIWHTFIAFFYWLLKGLKKSNYIIGHIELTDNRISRALENEKIDLVIYEYWHAWKSIEYFKCKNIPVILDMHDILSNAYQEQLDQSHWIPKYLKQRLYKLYVSEEYNAWSKFDGIIAINKLEFEEIRKYNTGKTLFYCPMGLDLKYWNYSYKPTDPVRFGFYGGLGSLVNQRQALFTANEIMPKVWNEIPSAELWIIGSNPSKELQNLAIQDFRIKVTGFIEDPRSTLSSLTAIFCPWKGIFGFRSRIVEVMALGIPVIASPDAITGMGFEEGKGLLLANQPIEFSKMGFRFVFDQKFNREQSFEARLQVEDLFSTANTYQCLFQEIKQCIKRS